MSEASNTPIVPRERLIEALIVAKCARFMMATCDYVRDGEDPCAVCAVMVDLGYESYSVSDGGLRSWRLPA